MDKMWAGRFEKALDKMADDFNSSIHFDKKMYKQDIKGSLEHASMLCAVGILTPAELDSITEGLVSILDDLNNGSLPFDLDAEDIHMFVEARGHSYVCRGRADKENRGYGQEASYCKKP